MSRGVTRVLFTDHVGNFLHEVLLGDVPRVGDSVQLQAVGIAGVVAQVTWQVGSISAQSPVIIRLVGPAGIEPTTSTV